MGCLGEYSSLLLLPSSRVVHVESRCPHARRLQEEAPEHEPQDHTDVLEVQQGGDEDKAGGQGDQRKPGKCHPLLAATAVLTHLRIAVAAVGATTDQEATRAQAQDSEWSCVLRVLGRTDKVNADVADSAEGGLPGSTLMLVDQTNMKTEPMSPGLDAAAAAQRVESIQVGALRLQPVFNWGRADSTESEHNTEESEDDESAEDENEDEEWVESIEFGSLQLQPVFDWGLADGTETEIPAEAGSVVDAEEEEEKEESALSEHNKELEEPVQVDSLQLRPVFNWGPTPADDTGSEDGVEKSEGEGKNIADTKEEQKEEEEGNDGTSVVKVPTAVHTDATSPSAAPAAADGPSTLHRDPVEVLSPSNSPVSHKTRSREKRRRADGDLDVLPTRAIRRRIAPAQKSRNSSPTGKAQNIEETGEVTAATPEQVQASVSNAEEKRSTVVALCQQLDDVIAVPGIVKEHTPAPGMGREEIPLPEGVIGQGAREGPEA